MMPDDCVPAKPFSISSIQRTPARSLSAVWMALRMFSSLCPTRPPKILPTSSRSSGSFHERGDRLGGEALAAALHAEQQDALRARAGRSRGAFSVNATVPLAPASP